MCGSACHDLQHPVKGDDNYYIIFTSGTTETKGTSTITCSALPTDDYGQGICNARASANVGTNCLIPLTCLSCTGHRLWLWRNAFCSSISYHSRLQTTLRRSFLFRSYLDLNTIFRRYGHVVWGFSRWKGCVSPISILMGKSWPLNGLRNCAERFPNARIINASYGPTEAISSFSCSRNRWDVSYFERLPIGYN